MDKETRETVEHLLKRADDKSDPVTYQALAEKLKDRKVCDVRAQTWSRHQRGVCACG